MKKDFSSESEGFSLVEMLTALIVISCIVAAFIPVVTKKLTNSVKMAANGMEGILFTYNENDPACSKVEGTNQVNCVLKIPDGVSKVNAIVVSGGGGGGGSYTPPNPDGTKTTSFEVGNNNPFNSLISNRLNSSGLITQNGNITVVEGMTNVTIDLITGAGGGGAGSFYYTSNNPESTGDCSGYKSAYIPKGYMASKKSYCMTRYSVGSSGGAPLPDGYHKVNVDGNKKCPEPGKCCFYNGTSSDADQDNRYVCNWQAASKACKAFMSVDASGNNFCSESVSKGGIMQSTCFEEAISFKIMDDSESTSWMLPSDANLTNFKNSISKEYFEDITSTLRMCGNGSRDTIKCRKKANGCIYSDGTKKSCTPARWWSRTNSGESGTYWSYMYKNKIFTDETSDGEFLEQKGKYGANTSRCITASIPRVNRLAGGGGGGAGSYARNIKIDNSLLTPGAIITISAGKGGNGGQSLNDSANTLNDAGYDFRDLLNNTGKNKTQAGAGEASSVELKKGGSVIWGYKALGGSGGAKITYTTGYGKEIKAGQGGAAGTGCMINTGRGYTAENSYCKIAGAGGNGESKIMRSLNNANLQGDREFIRVIEDTDVQGGNGGDSGYNSATSLSGGGKTDNATAFFNINSLASLNAAQFGAGGAGAFAAASDRHIFLDRIDSRIFHNSFENGGTGGSGYVKVSYGIPVNIYPGGGGAGGNMAHIENMSVTPNKVYSILVGGGGTGGNAGTPSYGRGGAGSDGGAGGFSQIAFDGSSIIKVLGGNGGGGGKMEESTLIKRENFGAGGNVAGVFIGNVLMNTCITGARKDLEMNDIGTIRYRCFLGEPGNTSNTFRIGGDGGKSAISDGTKGGNESSQNGKDGVFSYPGDIIKKYDYGAAGAGGGGGGFQTGQSSAGKGGNGGDGYVYIYWKKAK